MIWHSLRCQKDEEGWNKPRGGIEFNEIGRNSTIAKLATKELEEKPGSKLSLEESSSILFIHWQGAGQ